MLPDAGKAQSLVGVHVFVSIWEGLDAIRHGIEEVRFRVPIEELKEEDKDELETILDELAKTDPFSDMVDPLEW